MCVCVCVCCVCVFYNYIRGALCTVLAVVVYCAINQFYCTIHAPDLICALCLFSQASDPMVADRTPSQLSYSIVSGGGRRWTGPQSSLHQRRAHSADPDLVLGGERSTPTQDEVGSYLQALEEQLGELKELTGMEDEAAM